MRLNNYRRNILYINNLTIGDPIIPESELILNPDGSVYHLGLRPEHLTPIILTVGDPDRVAVVSKYFDKIEFIVQCREFRAHIGHIGSQRLMVISSGMGTDNVEILLTELDALANVDLDTRQVKKEHTSLQIIRIGTSGALQETVPLDSHLISNYAFGLDTLMQFYEDIHASGYEKSLGQQLGEHLGLAFSPYVKQGSAMLRQKLGAGMIAGNTVTCPGFYAPQGRSIRAKPQQQDLIQKMGSFAWDQHKLTNFEMETAGYYALGSLLGHEIASTNAIIVNRVTHQFSRQPAQTVDLLIRKVLEQIAH